MLGVVQLAAEQLDDAEEAFRAAVQFSSSFADAWVNLGSVSYRQRYGGCQSGDAPGACRRSRASRRHSQSRRLPPADRRGGGRRSSVAEGTRARSRKRGGAVNLAAELLQEERAAEALTLLDAVLPPAERRLLNHWQAQRALALLQLGQPAEARRTIDSINARETSLRRSCCGGVSCWPRPRATARAPALLPSRWRWRWASPFAGSRAQYNVSVRSGEILVVGRRCGPGLFPLDRGPPAARPIAAVLAPRLSQLCRRDDRAFDRARLHDGPRADNRDPAPIFIVGMPRSGTTLAEQIIGAHRDVFGAGERMPLSAAFGTMGGGWETAAGGRARRRSRRADA